MAVTYILHRQQGELSPLCIIDCQVDVALNVVPLERDITFLASTFYAKTMLNWACLLYLCMLYVLAFMHLAQQGSMYFRCRHNFTYSSSRFTTLVNVIFFANFCMESI